MPSPDKRAPASGSLQVRPLSPAEKPVRRDFPGPRETDVPLRVAIDRAAYAELIAHAKSSLDAEVCGVLVGQICEDAAGLFVHVEALIRGNAATQAATHVTFTQATWDAIHQTLEREHPKRRIVGWYHTHPGFGVEFSEMDLFIQRNFFAGPTQIALVTDPMNGAVAIVGNIDGETTYLSRFWVDAREQTGTRPAAAAPTSSAQPAASASSAAPAGDAVKNLEARIGQLIQANDELRALFHRVVLTVGLTACLGIIAVIGYLIYRQYSAPLEPPRLNSFAPVPVRIGDKTVLLGVGVVEWQVPDELNAMMLDLAERDRAAAVEAAAAKAKAAKAQTGEDGSGADQPAPAKTGSPDSKPAETATPPPAAPPHSPASAQLKP